MHYQLKPMKNKNMEKQKNNFNRLTYFIILFFIITFLVTGFFFGRKLINEKKEYKINITQSPTKQNYENKVTKGELVLKKNDDFNYQVIASSNNYNITGFDVLIEAETPDDLEAISFFSPLDSFSLYQTKKDNLLIITGVRKIGFDNQIIFKKTPIVNLKTKKAINLNLKKFWNKYSTKFVDNETNVLYPNIILK